MRYLLTMLAAAMTMPVMAQLDNTVEVTNEVKPVVSDAKKVEVKAKAAETKVQQYTMEYALQSQPLQSFVESPIGDYRSDAVKEGDSRGYVHLGGGSHGNLDGQIAYQFDFTDKDALALDLSLKGFNGKTRENDCFGVEEWKSRDYRNRAALKYSHRFANGADFYVKGAFENHLFNYLAYGGDTDKQHNVLGNAVIGIDPYRTGELTVGASAGVKFFQQNYLTSLQEKLGEMLIHANADVAYQLDDVQRAGLGVEFVNSSYKTDGLEGAARFRFTPHYIYNSDLMRLKLGVFASAEGRVAPDVEFVYRLDGNSDVYAEVRGYEKDNDFRSLSGLNPYFVLNNVPADVEAEFHQLDAKIGYRLKGMAGWNADVSGGFDMAEHHADMGGFMASLRDYVYPLMEFRKSRCFYVNADFTYTWADILRLDAKNRLNIESNKHGDEWIKGSYVRPVFSMDWKLDVKMQQLVVGLDWAFACYSEPDAPVVGSNSYERSNTMNLGASVRYTLRPLTLFVKGDNLLNQNYDRYFGYRNIGANFLAGFAVSF